MIVMVVLGAHFTIDSIMICVVIAVSEDKREFYSQDLVQVVATHTCHQQVVTKLAGRLLLTVSVAADRVGACIYQTNLHAVQQPATEVACVVHAGGICEVVLYLS